MYTNNNVNRLKWSDFEWFKKNSRIYFDDSYIKCSEAKGKDEKIIFPLKDQGKHITFSISKRYFDLHVTSEDKSTHTPAMEIKTQKAKKIALNSIRGIDPESFFIPINHKSLKKLVLVDPRSKKFMKNFTKMNDCNILPPALLNSRISSMRNYHGKILFAYDCFGRFKGTLKCDHAKNGFYLIPASLSRSIQNKLVNMDKVKDVLLDEGIKEDKNKIFWKRWYKVIEFHDSVNKQLEKAVFSVRCFFKLKIR